MLADRHQKGRQILVLVGIEQRRGKLLCTHGRRIQYVCHVQRVVEGIHQAVAGFWIFQDLPEQCLCLFFSWKYRCHQKDPLSVYFQLPIIDS